VSAVMCGLVEMGAGNESTSSDSRSFLLQLPTLGGAGLVGRGSGPPVPRLGLSGAGRASNGAFGLMANTSALRRSITSCSI
jgi:hypothetical protein